MNEHGKYDMKKMALAGLTVVITLLLIFSGMDRPKGWETEEDGDDYNDDYSYGSTYKKSYQTEDQSSYNGYSSETTGSAGAGTSNSTSTTYSGNTTYSDKSSGNAGVGSRSTVDSYDEGYDDIYMDSDYDDERYSEDDDYASGVDDAMEDYEEDW